ncbi:MAG: NADH-quinone oxidoreductase subunit C [Rhodocyclales bacterium]|nr:NADH-quinone oxidoreductase subunit C [Rhodocyclales bacterium]
MDFGGLALDLTQLDAPLPIWRVSSRAEDWSETALLVAESGGRLVSLWASDRRQGASGSFTVSAAYATSSGLLCFELPLDGAHMSYPSLAGIFPCALRMQRAIADLHGLVAEGAEDTRPWFNHGAWPEDRFPLRRDFDGAESFPACQVRDYLFVRVAGDGVHEIPVGPVHAGIIEPGHFRFSVVGEKVLRLEERLGYTHKGIEKRFESLPAQAGYRLAGRVSGDATVAYAWAYCMALEGAVGGNAPERARWLRAMLLERERIANHLGDLGALGNDAAFAFGLTHFMRLKEDWLRLNKRLFGHRFAMDRIVPGGVALDVDAPGAAWVVEQCDAVEREVRTLRRIYDDHAGLQDRFVTTGRVTPALAKELGLTGLAGRASGFGHDLRADLPMSPYAELQVRKASHSNGDVAARVFVRFEEILESLRLIREIVTALPPGEVLAPLPSLEEDGFGIGWVESWRGEVLVALETEGERIRRCHCHDPSWQNWPVLEHAVMGNIVPDFPLINKSFNLSYSGHDL